MQQSSGFICCPVTIIVETHYNHYTTVAMEVSGRFKEKQKLSPHNIGCICKLAHFNPDGHYSGHLANLTNFKVYTSLDLFILDFKLAIWCFFGHVHVIALSPGLPVRNG